VRAKRSQRPPVEVPGVRQPTDGATGGFGWRLPFAWIAVSVVVLRGLAWFSYDPVTFDSAVYFEMAALFRGGRWAEALAYDYPPLYPLLIAGLQGMVGRADAAGVLVAAVADLAILVPIFAIARLAVDEAAAWGAAFLWVAHLSAIRLGVQALSDAPTALFVVIAIYAGLRALRARRFVWAWGAGMAGGLAFLCRPEGLEPVVGLALFYALYADPSAQSPAHTGRAPLGARRSTLETPYPAHAPAASSRAHQVIHRMGWVLAPLMGWALVAGPYVAYISVEAGSFTLSKKKSAASIVRSSVRLPLAESQAPSDRSPEPSGESRESGAGGRDLRAANGDARAERTVAPSPGQGAARRLWARVDAFQKPLVNGLTPLLLVTGAVGTAGILRRRGERWNRTLALLSGLFIVHFSILVGLAAQAGPAYLGRHHFLLMAVYALPTAGAGLAWSWVWMTGKFQGQRWVPSVALGLVVVATAFAVVIRGPEQGRSLREAAVWIRSQVAGTPVIVTRLAKLTYHAGAERVDLAGTYDEILRRARGRSAHFVALYPDLVRLTSPDFLEHLPSPDLELAQVFPEPSRNAPDQRLEIYRIRRR